MSEPDQNSINTIIEMGFSHDDAVAALKATNGDVNSALNYMFNPQETADPQLNALVPLGQPPEQSVPAPIEPGYLNDHIYNSQTPVLPPRPSPSNDYYSQPTHIEDVDHKINNYYTGPDIAQSDDDSNYGEEFNRDGEFIEKIEFKDYSVYTDVEKYKRPDNSPTVLMPLNGGLFESYLNPILTIFNQIPLLKRAIYHYHFDTLGFHPNWFKGEIISLPSDVTIIQKDKESYDLRFLLEVQRLFGFLDGGSERAFASMKNFIKAFPKDAQARFGSIDNIRDAYDCFYGLLCDELRVSGVENPSNFFENTVYDAPHNETRKFGMFQIEADEIQRDLYRSLHGILWGSPIETTQTINELADVITISLEASYDDVFVPTAIEIDEVFYPQVYTGEFKPIIDEVLKKQRLYEEERRSLSSQLLKTRVHNGKNIFDNLKSSIEFLSSELEGKQDDEFDQDLVKTIKELEQIEIELSSKKASLTEEHRHYQELKHSTSAFNIDMIIQESKIENLEPYILTGVVFSTDIFVYLELIRDAVDEEVNYIWHYIEYGDQGKDFSSRVITFDEIKRAVQGYTSKHLSTPIVLTYVREELLLEDTDVVIPKSVQEFINKDKAELEKLLELIAESDDEIRESEPLIDLDDVDDDSDAGRDHLIHIHSDGDSEVDNIREKESDLLDIDDDSISVDKKDEGISDSDDKENKDLK